MSQDNSGSVGNKLGEAIEHTSDGDISKQYAYYPPSNIPLNYGPNGSLPDPNQGQPVNTDPSRASPQNADGMQYQQQNMIQMIPGQYSIPSGQPHPSQGYVQQQMAGNPGIVPQGYVPQDLSHPYPHHQQQQHPMAQGNMPMSGGNNAMMMPGSVPAGMHGGVHPMMAAQQQQHVHPMHAQNGGQTYAPPGYPPQYQQQQQQPQQHMIDPNAPKMTAKPWHSPDDLQTRQFIAEQIVSLLQQRRPNATEDWQQKLPNMGKRLEDALYLKASSLEEYRDINTLKARLQQLAQQMNSKNAGPSNRPPGGGGGGPQMGPPGMQQPGMQPGQLPAMQQAPYPAQIPQIPPYVQHQSQQQQQQFQPQQQPQTGQTSRTLAAVSSQYPTGPPSVYKGANAAMLGSGHGQHMPNTMGNGMSAIEGHGGQQMQMQPQMQMQQSHQQQSQQQQQQYAPPILHVPQPQQHVSMDHQQGVLVGNPEIDGSLKMSMPPQTQQAQKQLQFPASLQENNDSLIMENIGDPHGMALGGGGGGGGDDGGLNKRPQSQHSEEHRRQVLKQQQQRLLLLRHASKCPHENGRCPVTPHCASMKNLWKHIMGCKDQECKIPHCVSSRYVLSHYSKCKDVNCPVCGPVREAIRRNYQKSQLIIDMSKPPADGGPEKRARPSSLPADRALVQMPPDKKPRLPEPKPATFRANNLLDPISCALYSFTNEQIKAHIQNIQEGMRLSAAGIRDICVPIVDDLFKYPHAYMIFGTPVDPVALGLSDYYDIVKCPMDLGTIKKRLDMNGYRDINNFAFEVRLTFQNAMRYNPKNSDVYVLAKQLLKDFDAKFNKVVHNHELSMEEKRANKDACLVCGEVCLKFEPPVYYCNGKCGGQRIRRNSYFYSAGNNAYHWCSICFTELREGQVIQLPDCNITKAELAKNKKKHSEESEEPWVQCDSCERWVHQICGLFNGRRNLGDSVSYMCPNCLMEKRKSGNEGFVSSTTKKMQAVDLPRTTLSDFIERRITEQLDRSYRDTAFKLNQTLEEVEKCPNLVLRQVSCFDKNQTTREAMLERYKGKSYPSEFPCRTKCIVLFQNIDGQDTLLFGMYVYEYGHNCPQPNQRRCYISYLDSVHYFRPKQYRTVVYHEILVAYLEYMKARGFHTAHIWACPPLKGDDYILYCHPQDQKTPKDDKLRKWYVDMLEICTERTIVEQVSDIYTEYLADPSLDATALPYFEGDYWVSEAEVIIRELEKNPAAYSGDATVVDDTPDDSAGGGDKSKRKNATNKAKRTRSSRGTSAGGSSAVGLKSDRDPVIAKLGSIIEPMKEAFFVCRLLPKEFAQRYAEKLATEVDAAHSQQAVASERRREEELQSEALSGNNIGIRGEAASKTAAGLAEEGKKAAAATSSSSAQQTQQQQQQQAEPMEMTSAAMPERPAADEGRKSSTPTSAAAGAIVVKVEPTAATVVVKQEAPAAAPHASGTQSQARSDEPKVGKAWHSAEHEQARQRIVEIITRLKKERNPTPSEEWVRGLPEEIKRHENVLYHRASCFEDYSNEANLRHRLEQVENYLAQNPQAYFILIDDKKKQEWHSAEHTPARQEIAAQIVELLKVKAGVPSEDWLRSLPDKAKRLEMNLYSIATSFEEYRDKSTLKPRLQALAKSMSGKGEAQNTADAAATAATNSAAATASSSSTAATTAGAGPSSSEEVAVKSETRAEPSLLPNGLPRFKDDTEDVDDVQESEHFDTRQSFLNLCQGNHYQFDQLRRAKHTSMMVLYHLHNPDAPKFVPSCTNCHKDILVGNRLHCETCDIDFCEECYSLNGPRIHVHQLRTIALATSAPPKQFTEEQRRERQRSIALHLQLLAHASTCSAENCASKNCQKMKEFLKHGSTCKVTIKKGCPVCKRIMNLLQLHARNCKLEKCSVPKCREIREHLKMQAMRQQAMDDRRRAMMNEMYSRPSGSAPPAVQQQEVDEE